MAVSKSPECRPPHLGGVLGGFVASLPVLGPLLGTLCLSCVGFGGAVAAGAAFGVATPYFAAAGAAVLGFSWWRSVRKARRVCRPEESRRLSVRLPLILGATALATYLVVTLLVVPALARAMGELSQVFTHQPTVQQGMP